VAVAGFHDQALRQEQTAKLAWLDGVLAFVRRDGEAINDARRDVRASGEPSAKLLDRSLAAFGRALTGDRAGARASWRRSSGAAAMSESAHWRRRFPFTGWRLPSGCSRPVTRCRPRGC
jgi:hypothetical protein